MLIVAGVTLASIGGLVATFLFPPGPAPRPAPAAPGAPDPLAAGSEAVVRAPDGREVFTVTSHDRHAELVKWLKAKDTQRLLDGLRQGWVVSLAEGTRVRVVGTRDVADVEGGPDWSRIAEVRPQEGEHAGRSLFVFAAALTPPGG